MRIALRIAGGLLAVLMLITGMLRFRDDMLITEVGLRPNLIHILPMRKSNTLEGKYVFAAHMLNQADGNTALSLEQKISAFEESYHILRAIEGFAPGFEAMPEAINRLNAFMVRNGVEKVEQGRVFLKKDNG
jgi:hypothetical protein